jgi:hypothetical protein
MSFKKRKAENDKRFKQEIAKKELKRKRAESVASLHAVADVEKAKNE